MDIHNIFNVFEIQSKESSTSNNNEKDILVILNIVKSIFKFESKVKKEISTLFGHTDKDLINYIYFNKIYFWLLNIDVNNVEHQNLLKSNVNSTLHNNLLNVIYFFEKYEEYEKCMCLKNILNILENSSI
jgi:hypothetical protein